MLFSELLLCFETIAIDCKHVHRGLFTKSADDNLNVINVNILNCTWIFCNKLDIRWVVWGSI